jgi:Flp pilus assembly pilin Flp
MPHSIVQLPEGHSSDRGASLVEYALLLALITMLVFGALQALGQGTNTSLTDANAEIINAM